MIDPGFSESVAVADFNKDGRLDILSAEHWYEAPAWTKHKIRDIPFNGSYIDNFSDLPVDVDGDGYTDIVQIAYFARRIVWLKNPGKAGTAWTETEIDAVGPTEFAFLVDLNNDGRAARNPAAVHRRARSRRSTWYELVGGKWQKHVVSGQSYGHGIGAGDVNGDKRNDILTPAGWLEAPADVREGMRPASGRSHRSRSWSGRQRRLPTARGCTPPAPDRPCDARQCRPGAPVAARPPNTPSCTSLDVNGDGRNDIVTIDGAQLWRAVVRAARGRAVDAAHHRRHLGQRALDGDGGHERRRPARS